MIAAALLAAALLAGCGGSSGGGGPSATAHATVTINAAKQYQRIAGFGVSEGFGQAKTLMSAPASVQQRVLSLLYSPARGAGLTILRNEISADTGFTIEPKPPSSPNAKPSYLTLAEAGQDQGQLWFAQQIKADYGVSDVFADTWSAPAFMKTNDSAINGGSVCGVPGANCKSGDWRQAYASYLVQYAKDYAAAGVPLSYLGPENETTIAPPQDGMIMSPAQTASLMRALGATLARSGLSVRAECCASIGWNYAQQFAAAIETDKAADTATALFTSHGYYVAPGSPPRGWDKPVWQTEWAPFGFQPWDPGRGDRSEQRPQPPCRGLLAARARRNARHAVPDRQLAPALRAVPDHGEGRRIHRDPAAAVARRLRHPIMTVAHSPAVTSAPPARLSGARDCRGGHALGYWRHGPLPSGGGPGTVSR